MNLWFPAFSCLLDRLALCILHSGGSGNWCESHLHTHTASSPPSRELCYHCSLLDLDERLKEEFKCRLVSLHSSHKLCCASWNKSDLCYCLVLPVSTFTYWHCRTFVADALRFIKGTSWLDNKDTLSFMRDNALCVLLQTHGGMNNPEFVNVCVCNHAIP